MRTCIGVAIARMEKNGDLEIHFIGRVNRTCCSELERGARVKGQGEIRMTLRFLA